MNSVNGSIDGQERSRGRDTGTRDGTPVAESLKANLLGALEGSSRGIFIYRNKRQRI
jgi:hypothetical protein